MRSLNRPNVHMASFCSAVFATDKNVIKGDCDFNVGVPEIVREGVVVFNDISNVERIFG